MSSPKSPSAEWLEPFAFAAMAILAQIPVSQQTNESIADALTTKGIPLTSAHVAILMGNLRDKGFVTKHTSWYEVTAAGIEARRTALAFYSTVVAIGKG